MGIMPLEGFSFFARAAWLKRERVGGLPGLRISQLPIDDAGRPVPWFVAWVDGKPEFRVVGPGKREEAYAKRKCWVCGQQLGSYLVFVIGPMCALNRISSEPPSHKDCAIFAA